MKHPAYLGTGIIILLFLIACRHQPEPATPSPAFWGKVGSSAIQVPSIDSVLNNTDDQVENTTFSEQEVRITFDGSLVSINNPWSDNGVQTLCTDGHVTCITTAEERIVYRIGGTGTGSVKIYSDKKVKVILDQLHLTNTDGPAISLQGKKRQFLVLEGDNSLVGEGVQTTNHDKDNEQAKGTLFAEGKVIVSGEGSLAITSNKRHALASDDYVRIRSGVIQINTYDSPSASDGIHTKEGFVMESGALTIQARDEGIQAGDSVHPAFCYIAGGEIAITTDTGDGIRASQKVTVSGGNIRVHSQNNEGIESKGSLLVTDGDIEVNAWNDAFNAEEGIYIHGGRTYAHSIDNDALDSNQNIVIEGGLVVAISGYNPETALDADLGELIITGGTILGIGSQSVMFVYPSAKSQQYSIWTSVMSDTSYNLQNSTYTDAMNFYIPPTAYDPYILLSSPYLTEGDNFLIAHAEILGGDNWHGLYLGAAHNGDRPRSRVTAAKYGTPFPSNWGTKQP